MILGIVSDPHANLFALQAVLDDVDHVSPDELLCLGDFVGYGPNPNEVVELLRERCRISLVGNHDLTVLGAPGIPRMNRVAEAAAEWTSKVITSESRSLLESLAPSASFRGIELAHASPRSPVTEYVLDAGTAEANFNEKDFRIAIVGHTHVPAAFWLVDGRIGLSKFSSPRDGRAIAFRAPGEPGAARVLLNPGSVGQPRDRDPRASWATFDLDTQEFVVRRVEYAIEKTQRAIQQAGLPEALAERLASGW